jgi:prepilin peptidase CpaA
MNRESILLCVALAVALVAAAIDLRQHRIPNWLTYPGILVGFALRGIFFGWKGLLSALIGCLVAGGVMLIFYAVRAMGAGDVKLLAAIGALTGPRQAFGVLIATAIFGGILAIIYAISKGRMVSTVKNVGSVLRFHAVSGMHSHPEVNLDNPAALRMPYGLAIALGTLYMCTSIWWR